MYFERNGAGGPAGVALYIGATAEGEEGRVALQVTDDAPVGDGILSPDLDLNDGQWHHVVAVQNSKSSRELFVDGVSRGTNVTTFGTLTLTTSRIGSRTDDTRFFPGSLDDVRIYNRALSAIEVKQLYNLGTVTIHPN